MELFLTITAETAFARLLKPRSDLNAFIKSVASQDYNMGEMYENEFWSCFAGKDIYAKLE